MLSHRGGSEGSGSSTFAQDSSSTFAHAYDDNARVKQGDESFMSVRSGGSGGSGEVKVGVDIDTLGDMRRWRDEEGGIEVEEEEEEDDGGDGWYEKAMEIIRQDALIQEQVLAATLL